MNTPSVTVAMSTHTLAHHLRITAEHYDRSAQTVVAGCEDNPRKPQHATFWSARDQFNQQAAECRAFADALEDIRSIGFDHQDRIEVETLGT